MGEIAIEDATCAYAAMHPKSRQAAIEAGNMVAVAEFGEQSMNPDYAQSRSSRRWQWPSKVLPP